MKRSYLYLTISAITAAAAALGLYLLISNSSGTTPPADRVQVATSTSDEIQTTSTTIGTSVEGREIVAHTYTRSAEDSPRAHLVFVGAIHGGYEWNTVLLSRKLMGYIQATPSFILEGTQVTVIPMLNPDGVHAVLGTTGEFSQSDTPPKDQTESGRFNANGVDLNRNFACNWQPTSRWRNQEVDAGTAAFSEPEARAMRDFVQSTSPDAVVFFHSAADGVYGASCNGSISEDGKRLMNTYANAAGYPAVESFDHYEITGDAESWLANIGIPSVSVELTTHGTVEWQQNKAGIRAVLQTYSTRAIPQDE
jgi:predicted deacylase